MSESKSALPTVSRNEVVFIDTSVDDYQSLLKGLPAGIETVLIDGNQNGIHQIADWAANHSGYDAMHILSHGSEGQLQLGTTNLNNDTLNDYSEALKTIGQSLTEDGDILLYGCHVASNENGVDFIGKLAQATSADIAASDDLTGAADKGGDWVLEEQTGNINSAVFLDDQAFLDYDHLLAEISTYGEIQLDSNWNTNSDEWETTGAQFNGAAMYTTAGFPHTIKVSSEDGGKFNLNSLLFVRYYDDAFDIEIRPQGNSGGAVSVSIPPNTGYLTDTVDVNFKEITFFEIYYKDTSTGNPYYLDWLKMDISPLNSSPTVSGAPSDISVTEDVASNVDLSSVSFADADGDNLTVTLSVDAGSLSASSSGGVTVGGSSSNLTLSGSASNINSYLDNTSKIKYTGESNVNGQDQATLTLSASDGNGGSLSSNPAVNIDITAMNDAPVLDNSGSPELTAIDEDPTTNHGVLVSALLGAALTDVDSGAAEGIALSAVDDTNGTWEYSIDGTNWSAVGTVSTSGALLLASDDKLRFVPDADYYGSVNVTYQGWDQSSGSAGSKVNVTINGGTTAFSGASETASITINAVDDAPTVSGVPTDVSVNEDSESELDLSAVSFAEVDDEDITVTLSVDVGTLSNPADGAGVGNGVNVVKVSDTEITLTGAATDINTYLDTITNIQYTGPLNEFGDNVAKITIEAEDTQQTSLVTNPEINIDITNVNDALEWLQYFVPR